MKVVNFLYFQTVNFRVSLQEDYIKEDVYLNAVNEQRNIHLGEKYEIEKEDLSYPLVTKSVKELSEKNEIKTPSKVRIAENITSEEKNIVKANKREHLEQIYESITDILKL